MKYLEESFYKVFKAAIEKVGIEEFKKTSFFGSAQK